MSSSTRRTVARTLHLVCSGVIGWALYGSSAAVVELAQLVAFPVLALSGLWMWRGPRLLRRLTPRSGSA